MEQRGHVRFLELRAGLRSFPASCRKIPRILEAAMVPATLRTRLDLDHGSRFDNRRISP